MIATAAVISAASTPPPVSTSAFSKATGRKTISAAGTSSVNWLPYTEKMRSKTLAVSSLAFMGRMYPWTRVFAGSS